MQTFHLRQFKKAVLISATFLIFFGGKAFASTTLYTAGPALGSFDWGERQIYSDSPVGTFAPTASGWVEQVDIPGTRQFDNGDYLLSLYTNAGVFLATSTSYSHTTDAPSNSYNFHFLFDSAHRQYVSAGTTYKINVDSPGGNNPLYLGYIIGTYNAGYATPLGGKVLDLNSAPSPFPAITWVVPNASSTASSTPTADFDAWRLHITGLSPGTTYAGYTTYGGGVDFTNFFGHIDIGDSFLATTSTMDISIAKRTALGSGIAGVNYTWSATSTICDAQAIYCSSVGRVFFVGSPGGATLQPISGAGTIGSILNDTSTITSTCDPNSGLIAGSICNLYVILLIPSPASLANFSSLASSTQHKPPFGYLSSFVEALGGLSNATSATSSYVVITTSTEASLGVVFDPLKAGLGWLLWLLLGFWGIVRLKIFNP